MIKLKTVIVIILAIALSIIIASNITSITQQEEEDDCCMGLSVLYDNPRIPHIKCWGCNINQLKVAYNNPEYYEDD